MEQAAATYNLAAIVSIDGRGQIVLPKEIRDELGLTAGSKLAVILKHSNGVACCVNLVPAPALQNGIRAVIDPATEEQDGK
jgi:AbrB family looped-hinge helix DNA binding protein